MISDTTAHLVSHVAVLGEPEMVRIKGSDSPVGAYRLLGTGDPARHRRHDTTLVGRTWELTAMTGILKQAMSGAGAIVGVVGPPGIGKSRIASELSDIAARGGVEVFTTYCEAHAGDIPFHAVARLLRAVFGVTGTDPGTARARLRTRLDTAAPDDLLLLDDLLGIRDPGAPAPEIDPDARRRRLTSLINTASLARTTPTVYLIEDAHWIDDVSDSMLADFLAVVHQTPSLVVTTYRPEYRGELTRLPRSQTIALAPLDDSLITSLTAELLGEDSSIGGLAARIAGRAAGNPFFAEEIVRDLAERGVIDGQRGEYVAHGDIADITVPSTLHATIAARVDRLGAAAKRTLYAAAAIGSRFSADLVVRLVDETDLPALGRGRTHRPGDVHTSCRYEFRHPLIRTVAYDSQLKSEPRRFAPAPGHRHRVARPGSRRRNAALIAEPLRGRRRSPPPTAGTCGQVAGRAFAISKRHDQLGKPARVTADQLPADEPNRLAMRIAPRTMLCGNAWRIGGTVDDAGFDELRELTAAADDKVSLAGGMAGFLGALYFNDRIREAGALASECAGLIESINEPVLMVSMLTGPMGALFQAGAMHETMRLANLLIGIADGDATMGNLVVGSPLSIGLMERGGAKFFLGQPGFAEDVDHAFATAQGVDPACLAMAAMFMTEPVAHGAVLPDDTALHQTAEALSLAEESGDDFALASALFAHGVLLIHAEGADSETGYELLAKTREMAVAHRFMRVGISMVDIQFAKLKDRKSDLDGAIALGKTTVDNILNSGDMLWLGTAFTVLGRVSRLGGADAGVNDGAGQENAAEVGQGVFVVAGRDAAPLLEPVEAALDGVA